jgi:hypothetical protein
MISAPHAVEVAIDARHHVSAAATALAKRDETRGRKTAVAYQRRLERAHDILVELGQVVEASPELGPWLMFWLAPASRVARVREVEGGLQQVLAAKCTADAAENPLLLACSQDPSPENRRRLAAAMRLERARTDEALALLEVPHAQ